MHATGSLSDAEKSFVPRTEHKNVYRDARVWLSIYTMTIVWSIMCRSPLPAMYVNYLRIT